MDSKKQKNLFEDGTSANRSEIECESLQLRTFQWLLINIFREPTLLADVQHCLRTDPITFLNCAQAVGRHSVAGVIIPERLYDYLIPDSHPPLSGRVGGLRLRLIMK